MRELEARNQFLENEISEKNSQLNPLKVTVDKHTHNRIMLSLMLLTNQFGYNLTDWSIDKLTKVFQFFFGKGDKNGVFTTRIGDAYHCEIRGILGIYNTCFDKSNDLDQIYKKLMMEIQPETIQLSEDATIDQFYEFVSQIDVVEMAKGLSDEAKERINSAFQNTVLCG